MELSVKTLIHFTATLLTGLSAGLFFAWSVSVIPGTRRMADPTYLEAMQHINRAILNPAFFLVFMGSVILLGISSFQQFGNGMAGWLVLGAAASYLLGTLLVTGLGNVPLNNELDALSLEALTPEALKQFRLYYESNWNRLHLIRTVFAVLSFLLALGSAFASTSQSHS